MPFNQQMNFPCELTLHKTTEGYRLFRTPVREIESLHEKKHEWKNLTLEPGDNPLRNIQGDTFDIRAEIEPADFTIKMRGEEITYNAGENKITCLGKTAPLAPVYGKIGLQILLDRTSIEVFVSGGQTVLTTCFLPDPADRTLAVTSPRATKIETMRIYEMRSSWRR